VHIEETLGQYLSQHVPIPSLLSPPNKLAMNRPSPNAYHSHSFFSPMGSPPYDISPLIAIMDLGEHPQLGHGPHGWMCTLVMFTEFCIIDLGAVEETPGSSGAPGHTDSQGMIYAFFFPAALALAAFFLLLRIITMPRNDPTTADPRSVRITGIRIAQTRGGKRSWRG